jgi:hypothetical protein
MLLISMRGLLPAAPQEYVSLRVASACCWDGGGGPGLGIWGARKGPALVGGLRAKTYFMAKRSFCAAMPSHSCIAYHPV